jgi:hypothetical protein
LLAVSLPFVLYPALPDMAHEQRRKKKSSSWNARHTLRNLCSRARRLRPHPVVGDEAGAVAVVVGGVGAVEAAAAAVMAKGGRKMLVRKERGPSMRTAVMLWGCEEGRCRVSHRDLERRRLRERGHSVPGVPF